MVGPGQKLWLSLSYIAAVVLLACLPVSAHARTLDMRTSDGRKVIMAPEFDCPPIMSDYRDRYSLDGELRNPKGSDGKPVKGYYHHGQDFVAPRGTPVYATCDGLVEHVGRSWTGGNFTLVKCDRYPNPIRSASMFEMNFHYDKVNARRGDRTRRGETVLGFLGSTGAWMPRSKTPHLHRELWIADGFVVNESDDRIRRGNVVFQMGHNPNPHDYWHGAKETDPVVIKPHTAMGEHSTNDGFYHPLRCKPRQKGR